MNCAATMKLCIVFSGFMRDKNVSSSFEKDVKGDKFYVRIHKIPLHKKIYL